jgi:hypothetical protein
MDADELDSLREKVNLLDSHAPTAGGALFIERSPGNEGITIVCGDRVALIRLSMCILRYAVIARINNGKTMADAQVVKNMFQPPSRVTGLFIQLNENIAAKRPQPRWSLLRLLRQR